MRVASSRYIRSEGSLIHVHRRRWAVRCARDRSASVQKTKLLGGIREILMRTRDFVSGICEGMLPSPSMFPHLRRPSLLSRPAHYAAQGTSPLTSGTDRSQVQNSASTVYSIPVRYVNLKIVGKSKYQAFPCVRAVIQNGDYYRCVCLE